MTPYRILTMNHSLCLKGIIWVFRRLVKWGNDINSLQTDIPMTSMDTGTLAGTKGKNPSKTKKAKKKKKPQVISYYNSRVWLTLNWFTHTHKKKMKHTRLQSPKVYILPSFRISNLSNCYNNWSSSRKSCFQQTVFTYIIQFGCIYFFVDSPSS